MNVYWMPYYMSDVALTVRQKIQHKTKRADKPATTPCSHGAEHTFPLGERDDEQISKANTLFQVVFSAKEKNKAGKGSVGRNRL